MRRPVAVVQARMGSTRLPGKVLEPILGRPLLRHVVRRVQATPGLAAVVVATSDLPRDEPIRALCREHGIPCFAGDELDVLDRFYRAAREHGADPVVRVTADCPLVDPAVLGRLLALYLAGGYDHAAIASGAIPRAGQGGRYPDGLDGECCSFAALERAWREATDPYDREHVTPYLYRVPGRFRNGLLTAPEDHGDQRWTVDDAADLELVRRIYEALAPRNEDFACDDVLAFLAADGELLELNRHLAVVHE